MDTLKIREPWWKEKAIGISPQNIKDETLIEITYKNKSGERVYPYVYSISGEDIKCRPIKYAKDGTPLYIVPIFLLKPIKRI